jgi:hypothetical protein
MRLVVTAALLAALGAPPNGSAQPRPILALSATPARVSMTDTRQASISVRNFGASRMAVAVRAGSFTVDARGRPRLVSRGSATRSAASWLAVAPRELSVAPGGTAVVSVTAVVPRRAEPGDHAGVVLFSTRAARPGRVAVRMRVGVRVTVRVPGTIVRRLLIRGLRVRAVRSKRILDVGLANAGNVTEAISRGSVSVVLVARGGVLERVAAARRELLPGARAILSVTPRTRYRGLVIARVEVRGAVARSFRLRL